MEQSETARSTTSLRQHLLALQQLNRAYYNAGAMNDLPAPPPENFAPTASWPRLRSRAKLLKRLRRFFDERGFLEVETPCLASEVVVERHLDPMPVGAACSVGATEQVRTAGPVGWLQCSPEAHMKRLLAAGAPAIFQVARCFRAAERGPLHNPEFTLVEWYAPGDSMADGMQLLSDLIETLLDRGPAEQISYREAFLQFAKIDPFASDTTTTTLAQLLEQNGVASPVGLENDRDAWLDLVRDRLVEPNLGRTAPTILYDWPESQAALAQVRSDPPKAQTAEYKEAEQKKNRKTDLLEAESQVAERFELYVEGIELANGYHELTDAGELRRRQEQAAQARKRDGQIALPQPNRLLAAMQQGLPNCTGVALGFDRVAMLAAGARSIDEVLTFPSERA